MLNVLDARYRSDLCSSWLAFLLLWVKAMFRIIFARSGADPYHLSRMHHAALMYADENPCNATMTAKVILCSADIEPEWIDEEYSVDFLIYPSKFAETVRWKEDQMLHDQGKKLLPRKIVDPRQLTSCYDRGARRDGTITEKISQKHNLAEARQNKAAHTRSILRRFRIEDEAAQGRDRRAMTSSQIDISAPALGQEDVPQIKHCEAYIGLSDDLSKAASVCVNMPHGAERGFDVLDAVHGLHVLFRCSGQKMPAVPGIPQIRCPATKTELFDDNLGHVVFVLPLAPSKCWLFVHAMNMWMEPLSCPRRVVTWPLPTPCVGHATVKEDRVDKRARRRREQRKERTEARAATKDLEKLTRKKAKTE
ncbi:unnamed protein product [Heligmosomoides polygyrus]|uniref:DUF4228 domain protein n=1 Tax=Heligmosomoides polygyrus TaxID=6339 RepID=A0A3P7Z636_HELPZ|nr:unnamed protein product [Heligmosomoides polygyrus]